jgi:hypothetical protein
MSPNQGPNQGQCGWPEQDCEICGSAEPGYGQDRWDEDEDASEREAAEAQDDEEAWRAKWAAKEGFESPPDPWYDESRAGEVPF